MKTLGQANEIIGKIERGDLNADLTAEIKAVLTRLQDLAPPKGKVKGRVSLTLNFTVEGKSVEIDSAIDSKTPKAQRSRSLFFLTPDGDLSTEHPQQTDMFPGPREVRRA